MSDTSDTAATKPSSQDGSSPVATEIKYSSQKGRTANKSERTPRTIKLHKRKRKPVIIKKARKKEFTTGYFSTNKRILLPVQITKAAKRNTKNKKRKRKHDRKLAEEPLVYNQDVRSSPRLSYGLEVRKVSRLLFKLLMNNYVITFLQCFKVGVKYFSGVLKQTPRKSRPATTTPDKVPGSSAILVSRFFLI